MSVNVPQSTIEKPLTVIDYIAALDACETTFEVGQFADQVPCIVLCDWVFSQAVVAKLQDIGKKRKAA